MKAMARQRSHSIEFKRQVAQANLASPMRMKGITIGKVDKKLSKQMPIAPSPSRLVSRGPSGSGNLSSLCRINSSWSGGMTDATTGGNASEIIRCASRSHNQRRDRHDNAAEKKITGGGTLPA
jgi:hypothetical protein